MSEYVKIDDPFTVSVSRKYDASPDLVFDAWINIDKVGKWLFSAPDGVVTQVEVDAKVGGGFIIADQRGDVLAKHIGSYWEIDPPHKLVFSFVYEADTNSLPTLVTIDIKEIDQGCLLTLTHEMMGEYKEYEAEAIEGWNGVLETLEKVL